MQEARRKPKGLITWHLRHIVFFISEGKSRTPAIYEIELFVTLSNSRKPLAHLEVHARCHGGPT